MICACNDVDISRVRTRVDGSLADITNGGALHHVPHGESLDRLVLSNTARAVRAADEVNVATALLVAAIGSSFLGLEERGNRGLASYRVACHPK